MNILFIYNIYFTRKVLTKFWRGRRESTAVDWIGGKVLHPDEMEIEMKMRRRQNGEKR